MKRRTMIPELVVLVLSAAVLASQYPDITLTLRRAMVASLQGVARAAGTAALKMEAAYQAKVAP